VNTPWQFDGELARAMKQVVNVLSPDGAGRYDSRFVGANVASGGSV
jgi:hypothetical protein